MNISFNWLREYIDTDADELPDILTDTGLEVVRTEQKGIHPQTAEKLLVGHIIEKKPHPHADRLSLTLVDIGEKEPLQIICGAPNAEAGQKVVVAPVGSVLHHINGEIIKLKKAKIRGEISLGMICAEDEIGLSHHHQGIIVLDPSASTGASALPYLDAEKDTLFEIDLTPNRIDGASHIGVARDIRAYHIARGTEPLPELRLPKVAECNTESSTRQIKVSVEAGEACLRYSGLTISGIQVQSSPAWLQNRLLSIGLKPINNVVDITNFVLFETGHPLHAFDTTAIEGRQIIVKKLPDNTAFTTLDGNRRNLSAEDLMICNAKEGMCIAGVYGGVKSGVTEKTKEIFLESACFDPAHIRKTARRHGLSTDASFRFERGVDPNGTVHALKRATLLIKDICHGKISSSLTDIYPHPVEKPLISLSYQHCDRLIGKKIERTLIKKILLALDFEIRKESEEGMEIAVPTYRVDVHRPADAIEEILRIYGYNNIEAPGHMLFSLDENRGSESQKLQNTVSDMLCANGFFEIISNSLSKKQYYVDANLYEKDRMVEILNPLSNELNILRGTMLFSGLEAIKRNINRQINDQKLFEFGKVYGQLPERRKEADAAKAFHEEKHLAIFLTGNRYAESWNTPAGQITFSHLRGTVDKIFQRAGCHTYQTAESQNATLSYGLEYLAGKNMLAVFGKVRAEMCRSADIEQAVFYADISWEALSSLKTKQISYLEIPKYPSVRRDLALLLDEQVKFGDLRAIALKEAPKWLLSINLFDFYQGEGIPKGKKSYALSFIFRSSDTTLTDEQVDEVMNRLSKALCEQAGASIR